MKSAVKKKKKKILSSSKVKKANKNSAAALAEMQDEADAEAWESGKLGRDPRYMKAVSDEMDRSIDAALGLQAISLRLPPHIVKQLKEIATAEGLGYQTYIRMLLIQHVRKVKKRLVNARSAVRL